MNYFLLSYPYGLLIDNKIVGARACWQKKNICMREGACMWYLEV